MKLSSDDEPGGGSKANRTSNHGRVEPTVGVKPVCDRDRNTRHRREAATEPDADESPPPGRRLTEDPAAKDASAQTIDRNESGHVTEHTPDSPACRNTADHADADLKYGFKHAVSGVGGRGHTNSWGSEAVIGHNGVGNWSWAMDQCRSISFPTATRTR